MCAITCHTPLCVSHSALRKIEQLRKLALRGLQGNPLPSCTQLRARQWVSLSPLDSDSVRSKSTSLTRRCSQTVANYLNTFPLNCKARHHVFGCSRSVQSCWIVQVEWPEPRVEAALIYVKEAIKAGSREVLEPVTLERVRGRPRADTSTRRIPSAFELLRSKPRFKPLSNLKFLNRHLQCGGVSVADKQGTTAGAPRS